MGMIGSLRLSFWIVVIGTVVLYGFFVILATIPPGEVAALTAVVGALAAVFTVRNLRLAAELADRGGDPHGRRRPWRRRPRRPPSVGRRARSRPTRRSGPASRVVRPGAQPGRDRASPRPRRGSGLGGFG